jgi:hypothetical protein
MVSIALTGRAGNSTTNHFGFAGPEEYPIDNQIGQLHVADWMVMV